MYVLKLKLMLIQNEEADCRILMNASIKDKKILKVKRFLSYVNIFKSKQKL